MSDDSFKLLYDNNTVYPLKLRNNKEDKKEIEEIAQIYLSKLEDHILAVTDAWIYQLAPFVSDIFDEDILEDIDELLAQHDISKMSEIEYENYCDTPRCYLNGFNTKDPDNMMRFNEHIHMNPHHWQYFLIVDTDQSVYPIDMPVQYIIEMLCDWHSYSRIDKNHTAYNYWRENKDNIIVTSDTSQLITVLTRYLQIPLESSVFYRKIEDDDNQLCHYLKGLEEQIELLLSYELGDKD